MDKYPLSIFFCLFYPPLNMKGRVSNMSEAIISRRGNKSTSKSLSTEVIVTNTEWVVPAVKGNVRVMIYGAGGGGFVDYTSILWYPESNRNKPYGSGGGGGWMNNGEFNLNQGSVISITIGEGGNYTTYGVNSGAGGTTAFGTYLSANGGSSIIFDEFNKWGGGGDGGSGGGCGHNLFSDSSGDFGIGGIGYQFGGGGGIGIYVNDPYRNSSNGGPYGGGGGTGYVIWQWYINTNSSDVHNASSLYGSENSGIGGIYGGNGGYVSPNNRIINSENGTNTIGNDSIQSDLQGKGLRGNTNKYTNYGITGYAFGGGGGFGGCGGNGSNPAYHWYNQRLSSYVNGHFSHYEWRNHSVWVGTGGGGGGYGGNGGSGGNRGAGGGGGYIGNGGNGGNCFGGGGGGYGDGGEFGKAPGYGGGGCYLNSGGNGICIIQYYI